MFRCGAQNAAQGQAGVTTGDSPGSRDDCCHVSVEPVSGVVSESICADHADLGRQLGGNTCCRDLLIINFDGTTLTELDTDAANQSAHIRSVDGGTTHDNEPELWRQLSPFLNPTSL